MPYLVISSRGRHAILLSQNANLTAILRENRTRRVSRAIIYDHNLVAFALLGQCALVHSALYAAITVETLTDEEAPRPLASTGRGQLLEILASIDGSCRSIVHWQYSTHG